MLEIFDLLYLKEQNKGEKILYMAFHDKEFVFKAITQKEYGEAKMLTSTDEEFEDVICQISVLYPEDFAFAESQIAGMSTFFSKKIIEFSLIDDVIGVLEVYEEEKYKIELKLIEKCRLLIKAAFDEYTLDEMENWSYEKIMRKVAQAEYVLSLRGCPKHALEYDKEQILNSSDEEASDEELIKNNIDPMLYYSNKFKPTDPLIDLPFGIGSDWNNEKVIAGVRKQIYRRSNSSTRVL